MAPTETDLQTNPFCQDIGLGSAVQNTTGENPSGSGQLPLPDGSTIDFNIYPNNIDPVTPDGQLVDFSYSTGSTFAAAAVIVKGGPRANVYDYRSLGSGSIAADTTLHTSVNPQNDKFYGISHIVFCSVKTKYT
ncbi:hypothetical protein ABT314_00550 [Streptomyces spiralis]